MVIFLRISVLMAARSYLNDAINVVKFNYFNPKQGTIKKAVVFKAFFYYFVRFKILNPGSSEQEETR
jgi:hypothetical protein